MPFINRISGLLLMKELNNQTKPYNLMFWLYWLRETLPSIIDELINVVSIINCGAESSTHLNSCP